MYTMLMMLEFSGGLVDGYNTNQGVLSAQCMRVVNRRNSGHVETNPT